MIPRPDEDRDAQTTEPAGATDGTSPSRRRPGRPRLDAPSADHVARLEEILAKASEVFEAKGYDAGTLDDVAEAMGMRKAGLYHYVRSKSHLLFLLFDRAWDLGFERIQGIPDIEDPKERLAALIRSHACLIAERKSLFTVFLGHRPRFDEAAEQRFRENERRYVGVFARAVRDAVDAGVIPPVDPRRGAMALMGMTSWVFKWYDPKTMTPAEIGDDFVRLILERPPYR